MLVWVEADGHVCEVQLQLSSLTGATARDGAPGLLIYKLRRLVLPAGNG